MHEPIPIDFDLVYEFLKQEGREDDDQGDYCIYCKCARVPYGSPLNHADDCLVRRIFVQAMEHFDSRGKDPLIRRYGTEVLKEVNLDLEGPMCPLCESGPLWTWVDTCYGRMCPNCYAIANRVED